MKKDRKNQFLFIGCSTVYYKPRKKILEIEHTGNMGGSEDDLRENIDGRWGEGTYDTLRKYAFSAEGGFDYLFTMKVPFGLVPQKVMRTFTS